ncbi:transportin-1-like [Harmonia axyridis]|uniref:transportin-1-like n=1 Tax=Harmonia axyridis TaxID=115357 RepID=UPI001E2796F5|nr:transportin-1-like [Harmonia axyridis]
MNWGDWTPQENILLSILEVLQEALVPDNEIQKNVQQKLNLIQNIGDFTYYLLFIISNPNYSEEIRSLSGILLKNNINSVYDTISQEYLLRIRQECLRLLQDPCKDIRISISNVLVMLAKDNLATWPELVPFLINAFDASNEFSEIALNTLFKICEELIRNNKTDEEIYGITRKVFPKLNEMLAQEKCNFHHDIIRLVNQFLQEYFMIVKQSLDLGSYLRNIMKYADSDDVEMQKQVSMTFDLYLDNREDSLLPHLHEVILYLLAKTQHKDNEVALQACEFWFTATKLANCKELLSPYMEKLLPVLLKNMKYSEYELMALKDCLGNDSEEKDQSKDIYRYQNKENGDEECYSDDEDNFNEEVDDCYIGWTLRKCSAASLDGIAVRFRDDLLPLLVPYLNEILSHQDYYIKESAILALGAVAEGCMMGLKPYLPFLINYLINSMNDEHSVIRVITCWTLGRYVPWIINSDPSPHTYFIPVMTVLLKHFIDDNKRVQRAAISAFCIFQETAQAKLIPYIDLILEGFEQGFQRFQCRSLYLLYDAIGALAQSVGNQLSKPEYINKLMPQLMLKFSQCDNYSDDNFIAVLECLSNIIPALEISFLPYSEVVYWHCLRIITDTIHSTINYNENPRDNDIPDKEPMNVAHDVLYSMALGLKNHFIKYVMNSNLLCLLHSTMMENMSLIRQTAIALYGELIILCFPYLSTTVSEYIPILIKNLDEKHEGVCNNAAWALGKLSSVMGSAMQPFITDMTVPFVNILRSSNLNRPMFRTVALSFCIICYVSNDINVPDLDFILKNCCMLIRNVKDSEEKDLAFRGLCKAVVSHPSFFKENFMYFCDAVASWNSMRLDLKENIKSILASFKEQCGDENWTVFYQQCPEPLKMRLISLYGI